MRFTRPSCARFWLIAALLLFAGSLAAAPIPLSKPWDLRGKRVVVVSAVGDTAMLVWGWTWFWVPRGAETDGDTRPSMGQFVAQEAANRLRELGVEAQVLDLAVDERWVYGEPAKWYSKLSTRNPEIDAIARQAFAQQPADAVLVVARADMRGAEGTPAYVTYGLRYYGKQRHAFANLQVRLYDPARKKPAVTRQNGGFLHDSSHVVEDEAEPADDKPTLRGWLVAQRSDIEDISRRVVRTLTAETYDRALRPTKSATDRWYTQFPSEIPGEKP